MKLRITENTQEQDYKISGRQLLEINDGFVLKMKKELLPTKIQYSASSYNKLCWCCFDTNFGKNKYLNVSTKGEAIVFVLLSGCINCKDSCLFELCKSFGHQFNFFYLTGENSFKLQFNTKCCGKCMFVILPEAMCSHLKNNFSSLFDHNSSSKKNTFYPLFKPNKYFSCEIYQIIMQIQSYPLNGHIVSLFLEAKILELIVHIFESKKNESYVQIRECILTKVLQAKEILEKHYKTPPSINKLALLVGTNATTLKINFKNFYKTTIYNYLLDFRMEKAKNMLLENKWKIVDVSNFVGYDSQANFTTAFKRKFGITPREFLKECENS